jgi:hypothetical protein
MPSEAATRASAGHSLVRREIGEGEASEDALEELTRHACAMARPIECATLLARWTVSFPDSTRRSEAARELRVSNYIGKGRSEELPSPIIEELVELYRGHPLKASQSPGLLRNAVATSSIYSSYYLHAFPFDRQAVYRAWSLCAANLDKVIACTAARRQAENELGPIYSESARR